MVSPMLLEILRCPVCVHNEPEGGTLEHRGYWLICHDCDRKYPIRDDIPVMLIDEGDRYREIPAAELPEVPPAEKPHPTLETGSRLGEAPGSVECTGGKWLPYLLLGIAGVLLATGLVVWLVKRHR